ncbi:glycosyl transferase [Helicobacter valdiviensis]|uniref:Glycosyl transferase n=1 Tax=Helicobacter valdiviensis TaxID=1458358 RepID=A0A2W6MV69_9HELI|nr:glycosyltransferase [Helicobacter valdiviensis]PZT48424.1 glycosyl transferase [Helicobacter valdiviensis]
MSNFRLLLSIRSLNFGGAERQWVLLAKELAKKEGITLLLCTLYGGGTLEDEISGIPHICIHKKGKGDFLFLMRYRKVIKDFKPDCIYSFMPDMNLFSLFASFGLKTKRVWGFRTSGINLATLSFFSKIYFYTQKFFSSYADNIICNSKDAISFYTQHSYTMTKAKVVYNGIDTKRFCPKNTKELKTSLKIPSNAFVFGICARMNVAKDYPLFCKGAREILEQNTDVFFISLGKKDTKILKTCLEILGDFQERFLFLDTIKNVEDYLPLFDCIVSTSINEGFSNSIAEAMSAGALPIISRVGESEMIADFNQPYSFSFEKQDLQGFINCLNSLLQLKDTPTLQTLKQHARTHIIDNFSIPKMVENTLEILKK